MPLLVRFTKGTHAETMTCVRGDGSVEVFRRAGGRRGYFVIHDLLHLAVESVLGYDQAFFGLIAAGWSIADFERRGAAAVTPKQAMDAEHIVGALQVLRSASPHELLAGVCSALGPNSVQITEADIERIQSLHRDLVTRWSRTPGGHALELRFPLTAP